MDMDYPVDLPEVMDMVARSDVIIVRFSTVGRRLLLDFRHNGQEKPFINLVRRARSAEERFKELGKLRPGLELPEEIITFHWPNPVASFQRLGVLDRIVTRFRDTGYPDMEGRCQQTFKEMLNLERAELAAAVKGEGYNALWRRTPEVK